MRLALVEQHGVTNGPLGRFTPTHSLNEAQATFVREYVTNGGSRQEAAFRAGYSNPRTEGYRLLNTPKIRKAIKAETERVIQCEGATKALKTMLNLLDPENPGQVRFQAAKWVLEAAGFGVASRVADKGRTPPDTLLSEMSIEKLEEIVQQGRDALCGSEA